MAIEKLKTLPWFFQLLIFVGIAGLMVLAVQMVYFRDLTTKIDSQQVELAAIRSDLANVREVEKRHRAFQQANAQLERQFADLQNMLPIQREGDVLIRQFQDIASRSNVRVLRLEAKPITKHETAAVAGKADAQSGVYNEMAFTMELSGAYTGLGMFFDQIAHMQRIVNISDVAIASSANENRIQLRVRPPQSLGDTVVAKCTATTYFQGEP